MADHQAGDAFGGARPQAEQVLLQTAVQLAHVIEQEEGKEDKALTAQADHLPSSEQKVHLQGKVSQSIGQYVPGQLVVGEKVQRKNAVVID